MIRSSSVDLSGEKKKAATMTVQLSPDRPLPHPLTLGVGWNWFDFFGIGGLYARNPGYPLDTPVVPDLTDDAGWKAVFSALDQLLPGVIRFGLPPDPHCDSSGCFTPETVHLERLRRINSWAVSHGATIVLDTFLIPGSHESGPRNPVHPTGMSNMAPANNDRYARQFVAPLLKWCVDNHLDAVRWFNPVNEALHGGVFEVPGKTAERRTEANDLAAYVDLFRALREACNNIGVSRTRIGLLGFDGYDFDNLLLLRMHALGLDLDPWVDGYSVHYYNHRLDRDMPSTSGHTQPIALTMDERTPTLVEYCRLRGKPLFAMEIGTFHYGWRLGDPAGPSSLDCCITVAEAVIRGMKAGLGGFAFWSFFNPNNIDGWFRVCAVDNGSLIIEPNPWHIYGLLSRHARPGARIIPIRSTGDTLPARIHAVALDNPDGSHVVFVINDAANDSVPLELQLPENWTATGWTHLTTDRSSKSLLQPGPASDASGKLSLLLSPMSLHVLEQRIPLRE